jgi:hypothetical protein
MIDPLLRALEDELDRLRRLRPGEVLLPTSSPLPFFAYPFLVATLLGWAWVLLREQS